jgi:hypothetical protein
VTDLLGEDRAALDAILALCGHDPHAAECLNDPDFGETVRQAVAKTLQDKDAKNAWLSEAAELLRTLLDTTRAATTMRTCSAVHTRS